MLGLQYVLEIIERESKTYPIHYEQHNHCVCWPQPTPPVHVLHNLGRCLLTRVPPHRDEKGRRHAECPCQACLPHVLSCVCGWVCVELRLFGWLCGCACVSTSLSLSLSLSLSFSRSLGVCAGGWVGVGVCVCVGGCVGVCVCVFPHGSHCTVMKKDACTQNTHARHACPMYCGCVFVCVCAWVGMRCIGSLCLNNKT